MRSSGRTSGPTLLTAGGTLSDTYVEAVHGTTQGDATATDAVILEGARCQDYVVLTRDLDFADMLAATGGEAPGVLLVREAEALASDLPALVPGALDQCRDALSGGAVGVLDARGRRVRSLRTC